MSPDGRRLVATIAQLDDKRSKYVSALWEIDPDGAHAARRLTWSARGESAPRWLPDGSLLFLSARGDDDGDPAAVWQLPAGGGEARKVLQRPGGVVGLAVARAAATVVASSPTLPGATDADDDERLRKERKDRDVKAILHEATPVRFWDHDLGPGELRLVAASLSDTDADTGTDPDAEPDTRELTPRPG